MRVYMSGFKRKVINFEIKPRLLERLDCIVIEKGMNRSEVIRCLINQYVDKHKNDKCK